MTDLLCVSRYSTYQRDSLITRPVFTIALGVTLLATNERDTDKKKTVSDYIVSLCVKPLSSSESSALAI